MHIIHTHCPVLSYLPSTLVSWHPKHNKNENKNKNKNKKQISHWPLWGMTSSAASQQFSLIPVTAVMCPILAYLFTPLYSPSTHHIFVHYSCTGCCCVSHHITFAQKALISNVHCNKWLVWFRASGFCYTINTGASSRLLSDILLYLKIKEILWLWFHRTSSFHHLQQLIDRVDVGESQLKAEDMNFSESWVVQPQYLLCPPLAPEVAE